MNARNEARDWPRATHDFRQLTASGTNDWRRAHYNPDHYPDEPVPPGYRSQARRWKFRSQRAAYWAGALHGCAVTVAILVAGMAAAKLIGGMLP